MAGQKNASSRGSNLTKGTHKNGPCELRASVTSIAIRLCGLEQSQFIHCAANALLRLARHVASRLDRPSLAREDSPIELARFCASLHDLHFQYIGVPEAFWPKIRQLDKVLPNVSCEDQHSPQQFARLLIRSIGRGHTKETWGSIFPMIYGKSMEELCAEFEDMVDFCMLL
ncbi:hypothetical protein MMC10_002308 [Thelotrema lepadinum]|nr:hypothetical protein [Thelotrema lepadinum]